MYMNNTVLIDSIETTLNYVIKMKKKVYKQNITGYCPEV